MRLQQLLLHFHLNPLHPHHHVHYGIIYYLILHLNHIQQFYHLQLQFRHYFEKIDVYFFHNIDDSFLNLSKKQLSFFQQKQKQTRILLYYTKINNGKRWEERNVVLLLCMNLYLFKHMCNKCSNVCTCV